MHIAAQTTIQAYQLRKGGTPDDWANSAAAQSEGQAPSSIYRGDDGEIYFYADS